MAKGLEFRHLRCFAALAEELHYGRAAQRLAMTQPPLSLNIQQLEAAVGTRLFDRDSRGVRLTAAGLAFRQQAQALLSRADEACALAREVANGGAGRLRVGFVGSMLFRGLPQWLAAFAAAHPRIEVALSELNSQEQIDALLHDELDLGLVHTRQVPPGLQSQRLQAEPFLACLPAGHALVANPLNLATLRDEPFVLFSQKAAPDYHLRIIDLCAAQGFYPRVRHEVRHWLSVVSLVGQGMGVSVVPASLQRAGLHGVAFCALAQASALSEVQALWRPGQLQPARELFLAHRPVEMAGA